MNRRLGRQAGFTLVELLIVVIILGVLAAIAIPQFGSNTEDAKIATLDTSLAELRNAVELYYHQHDSTYPGAHMETDGSPVATAAQAENAFVLQLTLYTDMDGITSVTKDATYKYGPYLKRGMPNNPFNSLNTVNCDIATTDISAAASDGADGWKFYILTGRLIADDGAHDAH
jgi:prepilin-type N-terminal cleavage/methylation domain-containing protein